MKLVGRLLSAIAIVWLSLAMLFALPQPVLALTATTLGDYDNVTVMQVSGSYDVGYLNGTPDMSARRAIAREFYRTHGDDYDFLVIFTNFNFLMPPGAKAFFSPARNNVQGIGLPLSDYTNYYSHDGAYLSRLEGTIDMANISSQVLEPTDPEFDDTLMTLSHEMLHRWAAYVHFIDGTVASEALLGAGNTHWSYLLDSEGSSLYGNHWRDNGDGTFTAIAPEQIRKGEVIGRIFSPLELYLMGLADKTQVPPLLLIDAPGIDKTQLPEVGATIAGVAKTVAIDDIIAAEGARVPAATRKEYRMAFIYAVTPGTWSESNAEDKGEVAAINRLQMEWEKRFSILTDGVAIMHTSLVIPEEVESNPGIMTTTIIPAVAPSVNKGVDWLVAHQLDDGSWQDQSGTAQRDTAAAVTALKPFPAGAAGVASGQAWLGGSVAANSDFLARRLFSLDSVGLAGIEALQNPDGGWGGAAGYRSNPVDTALAVKALTRHGSTNTTRLAAAVDYLGSTQNADGGWGAGSGGSQVQPTASALLALNDFRATPDFTLDAALTDGVDWLVARQNADGGFGNSPSTIYDTAVALTALQAVGAGSATATGSAVNYLLGRQDQSGSWNHSAFQTALAVDALYAGTVAADLAITPVDIRFNPIMVPSVPSPVTVTATIRNLGSTPVPAVKVALFENDPAQGNLLGEQVVSVPGNGSTPATFNISVTSTGLHDYFVVVDGNRQITEANEWNNTAGKTLSANMAPPVVGFSQGTAAGSEAVAGVPLIVTLSYPWPEPITVNYAVDASSTATPAADYLLAAGVLTFAADQTSRTIDLAIVNDLVAEADETVTVNLSNPSLGVLGTARHTYTIRDDEAPVVTITSPPAGVIGLNTPPLLYATTGSNVVVAVDGGVVAKASGDTLGPLTDGAHFVQVSAGNSYGTVTTRRVDFTVDTSLPTVIITAPKGVQTTRTPLLDYLVDGAVTIVVKVDNVAVNKVSGQFLDPLAEGSHTLTVTATNAAGRSNEAASTFVVDTIPPSVALCHPYDGGVIEEADPQLLYTLSESGTVTVRIDGQAVAKAAGDRLATLSDGEHTVAVTLTDANGISATATAVFVVELDAETAHVTAPAWTPPNADLWTQGDTAVDREGNVYLAGLTGGGYDLYLAKYNRQGTAIWSTVAIAGNLEPNASAMGVDAAGNLYVAFTSIDGVGGFAARAGRDVYLAKFDSSGTRTGLIQLASGYDDYVHDLVVTGSGELYVTGVTGGSLFPGTSGGYSTWVARFDASLACQWGGQQTHGSYYDPESSHVALGPDGTVYVAGKIQGRFANSGTQVGLYDYYIARWSASGYYLGVVQGGTAQSETVVGLGTDLFGNVYLLGSTAGAFSGYVNSGSSDYFIVKYNAASQLQWTHQWGTASSDIPAGLEIEPDGDLYVIEHRNLTKFNRNKHQVWTSQKLTANGFDEGGSAIGPDGSLYAIYASLYDSYLYKYSDPRVPDITLTAPGLTNQESVAVQGTRTANAEIFLSTDSGATCDSLQFPTTTSWTCTLAGLREGANMLQAVVRNPEGFRNRTAAKVVKDTAPPLLTVTVPEEGATYTAKPTPSYTAPEATVAAYLNGQPVDQLHLPLQGLLPGPNVFRLEAVDPAGNGSSVTVTFHAVGAAIGETAYPSGVPSQFGTSVDEEVDQVFADAAKNIYVTGTTSGNLHGVTNNGLSDMFVSKYDSAGNRQWTRLYGTQNTEYGRGIAVDAAGNLYLLWEVHYPSVKGKSQNWSDIVLAKYDVSNTLLWSRSISSTARDYAGGLTFDASGNVWAAGTTQGSLNGYALVGASDAFLVGFDSAGTQLRLVTTMAAGADTGTAVGCDRGYGVYLTGRDGNGVPYVRRFITTGGEAAGYGAIYAAPAAGESHAVVAVDPLGTVLVAGSIDLGGGGGSDAFLAKCTADGCMTQHLATAGVDAVKGMAVDSAWDIFLVGDTDRSLLGQPWAGGQDAFVAKFNRNLQRLWVSQFGTTGHDAATAIGVGTLNSLFVAGKTTGSFGGANAGGTDAFLVKLVKPFGPTLTVNPVISPTQLTSQIISGTVSLPSTLTVSHNPAVSVSNPVINPDGTWSFTVDNLVANANNALTINATDVTGTTSKSVSIAVDTLPPGLVINPVVSPTRSTSQTITGTVESGALLTVEINPPSQALPVSVVNGAWNYAAALSPGDNTLMFTAVDGAGNTAVRTTTITSRPPELTVSPAVVPQGEPSTVTLTVEQFDPAAPKVPIRLVRDVTGDGSPAGDPAVRLFAVLDGTASADPNVPGDEDGTADGRIVTTLAFDYRNDVQLAAGDYLFVADTQPVAVVKPFTVLEHGQLQTIRGYVTDSAGTPKGGATVQLLDRWGHSYGYAFTDAAGHYLFNVAQPGEYRLLPMLANFVAEKASLAVHPLAAGQQLTVDLPLVAGSFTTTGQLLDAGTLSRIEGGILVRAENDRYVAAPMTRTAGAYEIALPAGEFDLFADAFTTQGASAQGYLGSLAPLGHVVVSEPSTGNDLTLDKATFRVCGEVRDEAALPVSGMVLEGATANGMGRFAAAVTGEDGRYCLSLTDEGNWRVALNSAANQPLGYVGNTVSGISAVTGPFTGVDLTAYPIDAWLGGRVLTSGGEPVNGIPVSVSQASTGIVVTGTTATDGSYRLGVRAGDWEVAIAAERNGYDPAPPAAVTVSPGATAQRDFVVTRPSVPVSVTIDPVSSPTAQSSQTIGGTRSAHAVVAVATDTPVTVGPVSYPAETSWQCLLSNLAPGENIVTVTATDGVSSSAAPPVIIDYRPPPVNTIAITKAAYDSRKKVLTVEATSNYDNARLQVDGYGPMTFTRLFKGKYYWAFAQGTTTKPATVTVSGPEGAKTVTVP